MNTININNKKDHLKPNCKLWSQQEGGDLFITTMYTSCGNCGIVQEDEENE